jgi:hypothetical protein
MVCYGPRIATIAVASAVAYVLVHRVLGRILHVAGLVLEVTLITCVAAAAAVALFWAVRAVQRRRAAAGACNTCRFRCQQSLIRHPAPASARPAPASAQPAASVRPAPTVLRTPLPVARPAQARTGQPRTCQARARKPRTGHHPEVRPLVLR